MIKAAVFSWRFAWPAIAIAAPVGTATSIYSLDNRGFERVDLEQHGEELGYNALAINDSRIRATAVAQLRANGQVPTVQANVKPVRDTSHAYSHAMAIEQFAYNGLSPATLTFNYVLTGTTLDEGYANAAIFIYPGVGIASFIDSPNDSDWIYSQSIGAVGDSAAIDSMITNGRRAGSVLYDVSYGDSFFVMLYLTAFTNVLDSHLTGHFDDESNLLALSIPEPAGWSVLVIAVCICGGYLTLRPTQSSRR